MIHPTDLIEQTRQEYAEFTKSLSKKVEKEMVITRALANRVVELEDYIDYLLRRIKNNEHAA
jgi:hypothetical protein